MLKNNFCSKPKPYFKNRLNTSLFFPLSEGNFQIPPLNLSYFDSQEEVYMISKTAPIRLQILPSENDEKINLVDSKSLAQSKIEILGTDIFPNHTNLADFSNQKPTEKLKSIYIASGLFPVFSYLAIYALLRKRSSQYNAAFVRNKKAFKFAKDKLKFLSSKTDNSKIFIQELSQILREYIGDKLNLNGAAFTSDEAINKLKEQKVQEKHIIAIQDLLEKFEKIQYGGIEIAKDSKNSLINQSLETLKELEKLS